MAAHFEPGIFFLDLFLGHPFLNFGVFAIQSAVFDGRIWEFITFQFLHGSLGHVLFNCMGLFFFGPGWNGGGDRTNS